MKKILITLTLILLITTSGAYAKNSVILSVTQMYSQVEEELNLINNERKNNGLAPLALSNQLTKDAMSLATEQIVNYGTKRPDGSNGYTINSNANAELTAIGYGSVERLISSWLNQSTSRKLLLGTNYKSVGLGIVANKYYVALLSEKSLSDSLAQKSDLDTTQSVDEALSHIKSARINPTPNNPITQKKNHSLVAEINNNHDDQTAILSLSDLKSNNPKVLNIYLKNDTLRDSYYLDPVSSGSATITLTSGDYTFNKNLTSSVKSSSPSESQPKPSESENSNGSKNSVDIYRLYNSGNNEHLYTTSQEEVNTLTRTGWKYEGIGWKAPASGDGVYRLYSPVTRAHLYTKDTNEVKTLSGRGWSVDNNNSPLFYSGKSGTPVYRLYNEGIKLHLLTTDKNEYNVLKDQGWKQEGIALYGISSGSNSQNQIDSKQEAEIIRQSADFINKYDKNVSSVDWSDPFAAKRLCVQTTDGNMDLTPYKQIDYIALADGSYILQFNSSKDTEEAFNKIQNLPNIEDVCPDFYMKPFEFEEEEDLGHISASDSPWYVKRIGADKLASSLKYKDTDEITVAVVDSGIANVPEDRIVEGVDLTSEKKPSLNDTSGHGSYVSQVIVNCTPGLNIKVMPIKISTGNFISLRKYSNGIESATLNGADVINLSIGFGNSALQDFSQHLLYFNIYYLHKPIKKALDAGIPVVIASGNENQQPSCPAELKEPIVVGATDKENERWVKTDTFGSCYGESLDLVAPGVKIKLLNIKGKEKNVRGTSFAAPQVAAAAAMLLLQDPSRTPSQIQNLLTSNAKDLGESGWDKYYGHGLLNLEPFIESPPIELIPSTTFGLGIWPDTYHVTYKANNSAKEKVIGDLKVNDQGNIILNNPKVGIYTFTATTKFESIMGTVEITKDMLDKELCLNLWLDTE